MSWLYGRTALITVVRWLIDVSHGYWMGRYYGFLE
jgi:hypothetical protein